MQENMNIEYKEIFSEKVKVAVIAFLNTEGGEIFVGIDDDGKIVGLPDIDSEMQKCASSIANAVKPAALSYIRIAPMTLEGSPLLRLRCKEAPSDLIICPIKA